MTAPARMRVEANVLPRADWDTVRGSLNTTGYAVVRRALSVAECGVLRGSYAHADLFRSRVVMARHGFGQGEYQYFVSPLPPLIQTLRETLYANLAPVANGWAEMLKQEGRYPATLRAFLQHCHAHGQKRPTPLLLKYGAGDYNRLHQDLYGGVQFPLQATVVLSAPGDEFDGGEFVLTQSQARRQTKAEVVSLDQGDMVIFAVNHRPVSSAKGHARAQMRHGVSTIRRGERYSLGVILHDAT